MVLDNKLLQQSRITHRVRGEAVCRIGKEPFSFLLEITYVPRAWLLEFIEYDAKVRRLALGELTTIEELSDKLLTMTWTKLQPMWLDLTLDASTEVHGDTTVVMQRGSDR